MRYGFGGSDAATPKRFHALSDALKEVFGEGTKVQTSQRLSGGDINEAFCLTLTGGDHVFCKCNRFENLSFFTTEADGLCALEQTQAIRVPKVLALGTDDGTDATCSLPVSGKRFSFLLLTYIESGSQASSYWEDFGHALAAMHAADTSKLVPDGRYGFHADNYIGAGPQRNEGRDSWIAFFRDCRLRPQMERAAGYLSIKDRQNAERVLSRLDAYLTEPDKPSLLHGDLWGGNVMTASDGHAVLIDPAAYVGHAEADLAMTQLFGSFNSRFYAAYREAAHLQAGYEDRRDLYNLYHLLNHLNLFGSGYLGSVEALLQRYGGTHAKR